MVDTSHGHLSVRIDGAHPPEVAFALAAQRRRMAGSLATTVLLEAAAVVAILLLGRLPRRLQVATRQQVQISDQIVWIQEAGPGGGGGGGGNHMSEPLRAAQLKGHEQITVPVTPPAPVETPKPEEAPVVQQLSIPAITMAASIQDLPGAIAAPGPVTFSQGTGGDGGAGTGDGGGAGPGKGPGLGPGADGGTGGNVFGPGSDATGPVPTYQPTPVYTTEAMRARIQGTVRVQCIVQPTGACTNIEIVRSLDRRFGLDVEAINNVRLWRFKPAMRLGRAVPYAVTIDVAFMVR